MHVYHYAAYERSALRRLMGRYGVCEEEVDALLRDDVLVDLYAVVRQGLRVGTPSYSIKALERLYGRAREGEVKDGSASIVAYHRWTESGEGRTPAASPLLANLRDYNREDCLSTRDLLAWLRRAAGGGGDRVGAAAERRGRGSRGEFDGGPRRPPESGRFRRAKPSALAEAMAASLPETASARAKDADRWRVTELLANSWSSTAARTSPSGGRSSTAPRWTTTSASTIRRASRSSSASGGAGDDQAVEGRLVPLRPAPGDEGPRRFERELAGAIDVSCEIEEFDEARGRVLLKFGPSAIAKLPDGESPKQTSLLLHDFVPSDAIEASILATAQAWHERRTLRPALRDLLLRHPPRVKGHAGGPLVREGEDVVDATTRLVGRPRRVGPLRAGTAGHGEDVHGRARDRGARQGGPSRRRHVEEPQGDPQSAYQCAEAMGEDFRCLKVNSSDSDDDADFAAAHPGAVLASSAKAIDLVASHRLVGGTAWFFSQPEVVDDFDVLFVDEAGQVSLANLVGMAPSAKSLVLLGDPMQLPQVVQGTHPGDSGLSSLEHVLTATRRSPPSSASSCRRRAASTRGCARSSPARSTRIGSNPCPRREARRPGAGAGAEGGGRGGRHRSRADRRGPSSRRPPRRERPAQRGGGDDDRGAREGAPRTDGDRPRRPRSGRARAVRRARRRALQPAGA